MSEGPSPPLSSPPPLLLGRGQAPGKAILLGEHAVVYGRPALAMPAPGRGTQVELYALLSGGPVEWDLETPLDSPPHRRRELDAALADVHAALGVPPRPLRVRVRSDLPPAAGMGSSAALAVALARAVADAAALPLSREEASRVAFETERRFHGRASGIDNTTAAWGIPLAFRPGAPPEPLVVRGTFRFLWVHSGVTSSTRDAVAAVAALRDRDPGGTEALFDEIAATVASGRAAIARGDAPSLAAALTSNQAHLRRLGVSHPAIEAVITRALAWGAPAAKLTGAGRGGMVLVLAPDDPEPLRRAFPGAVEGVLG